MRAHGRTLGYGKTHVFPVRRVSGSCRRSASRLGRTLYALIVLAALGAGPTGCGGGADIDIASGPWPVIGSAFPTALLIPQRHGGNTAYIQTPSPPLRGVVTFDLDTFPPPLHSDFYDLRVSLQGIPDGMIMLPDRDLAFITTSGEVEGVFPFNPAESFSAYPGFTYTGVQFTLPGSFPDSQGKLVDSVKPVFTAGAALLQGKVYIPTSNYIRAGANPVCAPGTVKIMGFDADADPPFFTDPPDPPGVNLIVTSDFNPTEVTPLDDRILLVTNTGVLAIRDDSGVPLTDGGVDVVDTRYDCIVARYPLNRGGLAFSPIAIATQWAPDGQKVYRGFLGSAAYNHVYELDLTALDEYLLDEESTCPTLDESRILSTKVLAGSDRADRPPILAATPERGPYTPNFIVQAVVNHDGTRVYATAFNSGTLAILEVGTETTFDERTGRYLPLPSPKEPLQIVTITDPMPSLNETSPGPLAVRPGVPGVDFQGPDVFIATGVPNAELRWVQTY